MKVLEISGLIVTFMSRSGPVYAVDSVEFSMEKGESCALVGESGCGKSVLGMAIMRLLPSNAQVQGIIRYQSISLTKLPERRMQQVRGDDIAMIPQNSAMALNPVMTIGRQVCESLILHRNVSRAAAATAAVNLLVRMGIHDPDCAMKKYPHEFSGGMRQRILVALSLACNPELIIADEPTAGLDILVRNHTIDLIKEQSSQKTLLLITHDLGCAHNLCSRIAVMYAGEIVESGPISDVLSLPNHPYTQGLLASLPSAGLHPIPGMSPDPTDFPPGCRFCPRCRSATDPCHKKHPSLCSTGGSRQVRCLLYD